MTRRCRKAEPDIADQAQMSPIGSRPRSPYPTARDQRAQKAAATIIERYGIYRARARNGPSSTRKIRRPVTSISPLFSITRARARYRGSCHGLDCPRDAAFTRTSGERNEEKPPSDGFRKLSWHSWLYTVRAAELPPRLARARTHAHARSGARRPTEVTRALVPNVRGTNVRDFFTRSRQNTFTERRIMYVVWSFVRSSGTFEFTETGAAKQNAWKLVVTVKTDGCDK